MGSVTYYGVTVDGRLHQGDVLPDGAVQISEEYFVYLRENFRLLDVKVERGEVLVKIDVEAYRKTALAALKLHSHVLVGGVMIQDHELCAMVALAGTSPEFCTASGVIVPTHRAFTSLVADAIHKRNSDYHARVAAIHNASTPQEIDTHLGE